MSLNINGLINPNPLATTNLVPTNIVEYTGSAVISAYGTSMNIIQQVLNGTYQSPSDISPPTTAYDALTDAVKDLTKLAYNGAHDPTLQGTYYLTGDMANSLGLVLQSLKAVGIPDNLNLTPPLTSVQLAQQALLVSNWQSLAGFGVANIVNNAIGTESTAGRSLQSMIELEYVKQGNDFIFQNLGKMEAALQTTTDLLKSLTIVQNVVNEITVGPPNSFNFPPITDADIPAAAAAYYKSIYGGSAPGTWGAQYDADVVVASTMANNPANKIGFQSALALQTAAAVKIDVQANNDPLTFTKLYKAAASAHFTQVFPTATPTKDAQATLLTARNQLVTSLASLRAQSAAAGQNSLVNFISSVIKDINVHMSGLSNINSLSAVLAVKSYIVDNQNQKLSTQAGFQAGSIQAHLTNAITSAESLNTTQKQDVNNYQFIFQQFYQSAADVLSKVSQVIEQLAQAISKQ